jgi:hypothetical protein
MTLIDRRAFITMVGGSILTGPVAAEAQPTPAVRRIGVIEADAKVLVEARKEGLRRLGWIEGENIVVEQLRWGDRSPASLQRLATDIVRLKLELVIASTDQHVTAAKTATSNLPIVWSMRKTRWAKASLLAWLGRAATSPGSPGMLVRSFAGSSSSC